MLRPYKEYAAQDRQKSPHRNRTEISKLHGSAGGFLAPFEIVAEGPAGLDALFAGRFAWPFPFRTRARKRPVCDCALRATCSAVPLPMILPPLSPPPRPTSLSHSP